MTTILCFDHPQANGRTPIAGETAYAFKFKREDGEVIEIKFGEKAFNEFSQFILDLCEGRPSYGDYDSLK